MEELRQQVEALIAQHGEAAVDQAIRALCKRTTKTIPAEHLPVISAEKIRDTVTQIDATVSEILEAGQAKEEAHKDRADLLRRKAQLETDVQLTEADALMQIKGEARSQYVEISGEKVALNNDQARDAHRRMASKDVRAELARVEGDIYAIDVEIAKARDKWETKKEAADLIKAKAAVQASLLNFLK